MTKLLIVYLKFKCEWCSIFYLATPHPTHTKMPGSNPSVCCSGSSDVQISGKDNISKSILPNRTHCDKNVIITNKESDSGYPNTCFWTYRLCHLSRPSTVKSTLLTFFPTAFRNNKVQCTFISPWGKWFVEVLFFLKLHKYLLQFYTYFM